MDRLAVHLVWCGCAITAFSQAAYVVVVVYGPPSAAMFALPALLAIAGPLTALTGVLAAWKSRSIESNTNPRPAAPSLPEPEAKPKQW